MLFLIEYDRRKGEIISFTSFADSEMETAENSRLNLELELNRKNPEREVVLLQASSEEALRRTHRRYFEDLAGLVKAS
jgi:hypothetical protein